VNVVELVALAKRFGSVSVVDGLSFEVGEGEVFGLVGPNGAGKTTTLKMLTTLLPPSSGTAFIDGFDVRARQSEVRRLFGYVPQMLSADGTLTGRENLFVFSKLFDVPRAERKERIERALEFIGLEDAADRLVRRYSGGMIRRLEIAQALLHRPRVRFLDEPTVGLDPVARAAVWDLLRELRELHGTTIFFTTHYLEEADSICSRIAILRRGRLAALDTPKALKESIGGESASLDDVFARFAGETADEGGGYRETSRLRRTVRRLG